jgi:hypothetical protein
VWYKDEYSTYFVVLSAHYNCGSLIGGKTRKSDDNNGRRHIRIVTSQLKLTTINHRGHQSIDTYNGKHWCEGLVRNIFFGIDIALGNAETDDLEE